MKCRSRTASEREAPDGGGGGGGGEARRQIGAVGGRPGPSTSPHGGARPAAATVCQVGGPIACGPNVTSSSLSRSDSRPKTGPRPGRLWAGDGRACGAREMLSWELPPPKLSVCLIFSPVLSHLPSPISLVLFLSHSPFLSTLNAQLSTLNSHLSRMHVLLRVHDSVIKREAIREGAMGSEASVRVIAQAWYVRAGEGRGGGGEGGL